MTYQTPADFRKSLEQRLKNIAVKTDIELQRLRRKIAFDRFLARMFTADSDQFFLKGGYAIELLFKKARATRDIDLVFSHREKNLSELFFYEEALNTLRDLAEIDLEDHFVYQIGAPQKDLNNAPYGGARYPISSFIDDRLFVKFSLDVALDLTSKKTLKIKPINYLDFAQVSLPYFSLISFEQQFAEKIHAYTLPRENRNSRVKDLVDLFLILENQNLDHHQLKEAIEKTFAIRKTHQIPNVLEFPPKEWVSRFENLAKECAIPQDLGIAFKKIENYYKNLFVVT